MLESELDDDVQTQTSTSADPAGLLWSFNLSAVFCNYAIIAPAEILSFLCLHLIWRR